MSSPARRRAASSSPRTCTAGRTAGCATLTEADCPLVARLRPSPNHGGRHGRAIDALVLHYTGMASGEAAVSRLLDPASEVSCHYLVWEDGAIDQLVAETDRAWHAGRSSWAGEDDINSVSIGIEMVNGGHAHGLPPYPPAQVAAVVSLCRDVCLRRAIPPARVLAHSDVAPDRKIDPGEHFPWRTLAQAGVGLWPVGQGAGCGGDAGAGEPVRDEAGREGASVSHDRDEAVLALQRDLVAIGYRCAASGLLDAATRDAVTALQRRWRPRAVTGLLDPETHAVARSLALRSSP